MALSVLISDDDAGMRLVLRKIIEGIDGFGIAGEAADGGEAVRRCSELKPDVVFIDVEMPVISGIEAAKSISELLPETAIIFITAHSEYMPDAFEVYATDYLLKPFKSDRVRQTLRRLQKKLAKSRAASSPAIMIRSKESIDFVPVKDILLVYREDRTTFITTRDDTYTTSDSLNELWTKLDEGGFLRSHRAYIINISAVTRVYPYGRWTYIVKLKGTEKDALITHEKLDELEALMNNG